MIKIDGDYVHLKKMSLAAKLVITALLSTFATMFQSAGGFMPGIGYLISFLATLPIFLVTCFLSAKESSLISLQFSFYLLFSRVN